MPRLRSDNNAQQQQKKETELTARFISFFFSARNVCSWFVSSKSRARVEQVSACAQAQLTQIISHKTQLTLTIYISMFKTSCYNIVSFFSLSMVFFFFGKQEPLLSDHKSICKSGKIWIWMAINHRKEKRKNDVVWSDFVFNRLASEKLCWKSLDLIEKKRKKRWKKCVKCSKIWADLWTNNWHN